MEKLNEYLQSLLSSCSDELRLEPDRNPYLVAENRNTDVGSVPLAGTQISTMVFPLIPPAAKSALPHSDEVEFVHPHTLGCFNFTVQKSPSGFIVTIRPMLSEPARKVEIASAPVEVPSTPEPSPPTDSPFAFEGEALPEPSPAAEYKPVLSYPLESSSSAYDLTAAEPAETAAVSGLIFEEKVLAREFVPLSNGPELEVISFNDPAYQTVFSDTATYEPPGRRDDFVVPEYRSPTYESMDIPSLPSEPVAPPITPFEPPVSSSPRVPVPPGFVPAPPNAVMSARMDELFHKMAAVNASDLHLSVSMAPMVRADGKMRPLDAGAEKLGPDVMRDLLHSIMPRKNQEEFDARHDTDFAYEIPGLARFRCNVFMDRKGMGGVFRIIPTKILTAEQLGLSQAIMDLCSLSKGLVVVTGPTGSGKSTTLCAMVDSINRTREDHIITIEDPIEFTHENQKCLVNQREVHNHTDSFKDALRAALREDPDILLVGEMRDLETISIAIETAETGHLVFGTLHTTTAPSTVDRIIDQFPADRQQQIRVMLSESLKGVIAQTLLPKKGGGRVAALEILIVTPAISNLIREGKTFQIPSAMQTGRNLGMVMLNDALFEHVKNGIVEPIDAYMKAVDKTGFETMLTRGGFKI